MPKIAVFEKNATRYDTWFENHYHVYTSELLAVKQMIPDGVGIEVKTGTGRFASPLNIQYGIEPSIKMGKVAMKRGVCVIGGVAENLPLKSSLFDFVTMIVTVCFLDDGFASFQEAYRVLKLSGHVMLGIIDKESILGKIYQKSSSPFYRGATFYSFEELVTLLDNSGFTHFTCVQTLFHELDEITRVEPVKKGHGEGSFLVISAVKDGLP
ncbi:MAG: class I SAM-dependent methyltransferase [Candidatus Methanofastidiosia archaeon]|jgi:ubiquinone/menaquinone biosynthesis C-methylase UbiE